MVLKKNTWHYKVWLRSYGDRYNRRVPETTNLCSYFHRVFWLSLAYLMLGFMLAVIACAVSYQVFYVGFWQHTKIAFIWLGVFVLVIGLIIGAVWWAEERKYRDKKEPGLFGKWIKAKKEKVCPLVEFED